MVESLQRSQSSQPRQSSTASLYASPGAAGVQWRYLTTHAELALTAYKTLPPADESVELELVLVNI